MTHVLELISIWAIPLVVAAVALYAIIKKVPVYTSFTTGAKEGFSTAVMIIPYLTAMLCAIGMFRTFAAGLGVRYFIPADKPDRTSERSITYGYHAFLLRRCC